MNIHKKIRRSVVLRESYLTYLGLRSYFDESLNNRVNVDWLVVLTFPNGGSTALAKLLETSPSVRTLTSNAEGQWIIPSLCKPGERWNPKHKVWKRKLKAAWLNEISSDLNDRVTVVEKSPPNMCRYRNIISALSPMKATVVTFARNPYATCASWHQRYGLEGVIKSWHPERDGAINSEDGYFKLLGEIWINRAKMLIEARAVSALDFTYEYFCDNSDELISKLISLDPNLHGIDREAKVKVKDYEARPISNQNEGQIQSLSKEQIDSLSQVFSRN